MKRHRSKERSKIDYTNFLADKPFINEFPRHIVEIHHASGTRKTYFVNNHLIHVHVANTNRNEGQLTKAINSYFNANDEALEANIFRLENPNNKVLVDTLRNTTAITK